MKTVEIVLSPWIPLVRHACNEGVGKDMAVATGLFECTELKHGQAKMSPSVTGGEKNKKATHPQSSPHSACNVPTREISSNLMTDVRAAAHLRYLVGNPTHTNREDLSYSMMRIQFSMPRKDANFPKNYLLLGTPSKLALANVRTNEGTVEKLVIPHMCWDLVGYIVN